MPATVKLPEVTRRFMVISTRPERPGCAPEIRINTVDVVCLDPRPSPDLPWTDEEEAGWLRKASSKAGVFGPDEPVQPSRMSSNKWDPQPKDTRHIFANKDGAVSVVYELRRL